MILEIYSLFVMNYIYNPMGKNLQYQDFETKKTRYQGSVTKKQKVQIRKPKDQGIVIPRLVNHDQASKTKKCHNV